MRVIAVLLFSVASSVAAHPHVRFLYQVEPVLHSGEVTSLRVLWRMDAMTSMQVARGIDADRNGAIDADELAAFAAQNGRLLGAAGYFTHIYDRDEPLGFTVAAPLRADLEHDDIVLRFELRLAAPLAPERLGVRFFDATWYVALTAAQPVLAGNAPCSASFRTSLLATQGWGAQAVPTLGFACTP